MTTKQYVDSIATELKEQMDNNVKDRRKMKFLYNLGTGVVAFAGASYLAANPYFALPVIGFAVSLQFTKKMKEETSKESYNTFVAQAEHLNNILKDGIDINTDKMKNRKDLINEKELVRRQEESNFLNALSSHRFASALVAGMAVLGGFTTSSLVTIASIILLYYQKKKDNNVVEEHKKLEETVMKMNNVINDYNIAGRVINTKNKQVNKEVVQEERKQEKTYKKEDIAAVDEYMSKLDRFEEYNYDREKRRI